MERDHGEENGQAEVTYLGSTADRWRSTPTSGRRPTSGGTRQRNHALRGRSRAGTTRGASEFPRTRKGDLAARHCLAQAAAARPEAQP